MGTSSRLASGSLSSFTEKSFPITRKGHFFSHYFFRDTREDFQKAVREILSRWGEKSCVFIDVHDFMDVGEISVKAVNERELVVEGHLEKKEDGSKSSKRFLRRFVVPGDIELEAVISVMSSDGVLKILAPKKEGHNRKHFSIDVEDMDDVEATVSRKFRNGHRLAEEYLKKRDSSSDDEELRAFAKTSNNQYRVTFQDDDEEFEGGHMFNKETKMTSNSSKDFKYNIPSLSMETRVLHIERRGVFAEDYCFANVRNSFSQAYPEKPEEEAVDSVGQLNLEKRLKPKNPAQQIKTSLQLQEGNFFQDSFFLDAHRDFSAALRQVLGRCNQVNFEDDTDLRHTDILERYRQLRSRDLREENQAAIVTSDKSCMKIIMDVHDFMSGDVQAKVVDEKELVIEGLVVKKEEGTSSETSHSFRRRFSLPQFTKITSVMFRWHPHSHCDV
ncbi:heat shock protein 21 [Penaeus vannamei]|uniref:Heat shock protein 21 n=1 Tax=Penaeus vannamei TaxID=6689 RepID=A0A3R7PX77_PENVA|nr:heat shock protein 21 [Penaeus vannamei]